MTATSSLNQQLQETPVAQRLRAESFNREVVNLLHQTAVGSHHVVRAEMLDEVTNELAEDAIPMLLTELRQHGLLWSGVAQFVGVTDAAIRKWRRGEPIDDVHAVRLRRLVAMARLYDQYAMPDALTGFGEWLATPVLKSFSATPLQLLTLARTSGSADLQPLLDWMLAHSDAERAEDLLDRYVGSAWRDEARDEQRFRIVTNSIGERILMIAE